MEMEKTQEISFGKTSDRKPHDPFQERSIEEERRYRKQRLAAAFRIFAHFGFDEGAAGYMTVRDPEHTDCFWVNPFAMSFRQIRARDLQLVDAAGNVLHGSWPVSRSAVLIHSEIHAARSEVVCVSHAHAMYSKIFASYQRLLRPITQDACIFFEDLGLGLANGRVASHEEVGKELTAALGGYKAVINANEGTFTVGTSVEEAVWWFITLEHSCQAEILAVAGGEPTLIPDEYAREIRGQNGFGLAGWYSAQPYFDWVMAEQPDCLDEG
jgi:ribulose-5-phosphate 4-epimerase/fuculose-1-phosphate aldolase